MKVVGSPERVTGTRIVYSKGVTVVRKEKTQGGGEGRSWSTTDVTMERRGWDEKKDWGRGKKGSGEGMGGWVHEGKGKQARNGGGWGPWSCPPPRTLEPSTLGAEGAPCPESQGKGRLTHWAGQTGRTLSSLSSAAACGLHHPKKRRGSSVPHNRTVSTAKGQTVHLPRSLQPSPPTAKPTPTPNPHSLSQILSSS